MRWLRATLAGGAIAALAACGTGQADDAPSRSALLTPLPPSSTTVDTPSPTSTPTPSPTATQAPAPVIVVLDTSAALASTELAPGMSRLKAAGSAVQQFTGRLPASTPAALIEFGSPDPATNPVCGTARLTLPQGTPAQVGDAAGQAVPGVAASLESALDSVPGLVPRDGKARVVVVAGPAGVCDTPDPCAAAARFHAAHPDVTVSTVTVGAPSSVASCLATTTRGVAAAAQTPAQLAQRLGVLATDQADRVVSPVTGVDGVRLGMTLAQARELDPTFPVGGSVPGDQQGLPDGTQAVIVWRGSAFALDQTRTIRAIIPGRESGTNDGLTVGMLRSSADAFLGAPLAVSGNGPSSVRYYEADAAAGTAWRIAVTDDTITDIALVARPA